MEQSYIKILLDRVRLRSSNRPPETTHWVNSRVKHHVLKNKVSKYPQAFHYQNPTMNKASAVYKTVKRQPSVIYDPQLCPTKAREEFGSVDCVMLGAVLADGDCGIQELVLSRAKLADRVALKALSGALTSNKSLSALALSGCEVSWEGGLELLFEVCLRKNFNLDTLVLDRCGTSFGDAGGVAAAKLMQDYFLLKFGGLVFLSMCSNCMTDESGVLLGRALADNGSMEVLLLSNNSLSDDTGVEFGRALAVNRRLRKLDLSENFIQVRGGTEIGNAVKDDNRALKDLNLSNNLMSDKCVPLFRDLLLENRDLEVFLFHGNQFRTEYMASLQKVWDAKVAIEEAEKERLNGDNSYKKTFENVKRRIQERGQRKGGEREKVSLKKHERVALESVVKPTGEFFGPGYALQTGIRVGRLFSPEGKGFAGGQESRLEVLPFFEKRPFISPSEPFSPSERSSDSRIEKEGGTNEEKKGRNEEELDKNQMRSLKERKEKPRGGKVFLPSLPASPRVPSTDEEGGKSCGNIIGVIL